MTVLVDTGILLAAANRRARHHAAAVDWLHTVVDAPVVTVPVIIEAAWQLEANVSVAAEAALLTSVRLGELRRVDLTEDDWFRVEQLITAYADLGLGTVDASVVAVAERLDVRTLATLNTRDFSVVRPAHAEAFELVPRPT